MTTSPDNAPSVNRGFLRPSRWRPLLALIDERPVDARRALNDNAAGALDPPPAT